MTIEIILFALFSPTKEDQLNKKKKGEEEGAKEELEEKKYMVKGKKIEEKNKNKNKNKK